MSRMDPLQAPYDPQVANQFDRIMNGRPPLALFRTIARSERAWRKFRAGSLLDDGPLTLRDREIVIDRTCARAGCEYEWGVHVSVFAERAGLGATEVAATAASGADAECWDERESVLIRTVDALHDRCSLDDVEYGRLVSCFDHEQILEIILLAGFYRTVSYLANGLAIPLEPDAARFPTADSPGSPVL